MKFMGTMKIKVANEQLLQEVKMNGGFLKLDYSNPLHFQHMLDARGGEEYLKEKYPLVYEIMCNTREHHAKLKAEGRSVATDMLAPGYKKSAKIRYVNFKMDSKLSTASSIHRTEINPTLTIASQIIDLGNNQLIDGYAITGNSLASIEGYLEQPSKALISTNDRKFHVFSAFSTLTYSDTGQTIEDAEYHTSDVIKVKGVSTIVKSVAVTHPEATKNPLRQNTVIVYDRQGIANNDYDYYFPLASAGNNIKVQLPFEGSATFDKDVTPIPPTADNIRLELEHPNFGTIIFNNHANIQFTVNGNVLSWVFPTDWKAQIFKKSFVSGTNFDLYCEMKVKVAFEGGAPLDILVPITISSKNIDHADPSFKRIRKINIYWGCVGKDTLIEMADGTKKRIAEIQPGEYVKDVYTGEAIKVTDNISGYEEEMMRAEAQTGDSILLTREHPVLTERGMVMSKNFEVAEVFVLKDEKSFLKESYAVPYNDKVYSLVLEKPTCIFGNNFIIGDFEAQQKAMSEEAKIETTEMKPNEYQIQWKEFIAELNEACKVASLVE